MSSSAPANKRSPRDASTSASNPAVQSPAQTSDLGVQHFHSYSLIIDARSPHEYEEDHVPGAINLPVVDDEEFAEVGILHLKNPHAAYMLGAEHSLRNIATYLRGPLARYARADRFLIYCFRGGKRSRAWADVLRNIGFSTDVLPGGWKAYRAWVRASLESLPLRFEYRVLAGLTGCGKTRLLLALEQQGEQILDLEGLASHRGSLIGAIPDRPQPTQKLFDSLLLQKLLACDPQRPVWVEAESKKIGNVQLPDSLFDAMGRTPRIEISASLSDRVRLLQEDYPHFVSNPELMAEKLEPLKPLVGGDELTLWQSLARVHRVDDLFRRVLTVHYDPSYTRSRQRTASKREAQFEFVLSAIDPAHLESAACDLVRRFGDVGAQRPTVGA